MIKLKIKE